MRRTTTVHVAGTAGGVGTTTVAALLFAALSQDVLGAPQLYDHAAGELGLRLPEGDDVRLVHPGLALRLWSSRCSGRGAARGSARSVGAGLRRPRWMLRLTGCWMRSSLLTVSASCVGFWSQWSGCSAGTGLARSCEALGDRVGTRSVILLPQDLSLAAGVGSHWSGWPHTRYARSGSSRLCCVSGSARGPHDLIRLVSVRGRQATTHADKSV